LSLLVIQNKKFILDLFLLYLHFSVFFQIREFGTNLEKNFVGKWSRLKTVSKFYFKKKHFL